MRTLIKRLSVVLLVLVICMPLFACGGDDKEKTDYYFTIENTDLEIGINDSYTIVPKTNIPDCKPTFSSSQTSYAIVDDNGTLTTKGIGICFITVKATDPNGKEYTEKVNIKVITYSVSLYTVDTLNATVGVGCQYKFLYDTNVKDAEFSWSSSKEDIATVKDGIVTGLKKGTSKITLTVTTITGKEVSVNKTINVKDSETEDKGAIDLYLIAGQSNAAGYTIIRDHAWNTVHNATNNNLSKDFPINDEKLTGDGYENIYYIGDSMSVGSSAPGNSNVPWSNVKIGYGATFGRKFGAEAGMAQSLSSYYNEETGNTAAIIKYAYGGTKLLDVVDNLNYPYGNWVSPSYEDTIIPASPNNLTGGLYRRFLVYVFNAYNIAKSKGYSEINIKGLYWMQGESDRGNPTEYKTAITYFLSDVRKELGALLNIDLNNMAFIVGEISETFSSESDLSTNRNFIAMQDTLPLMINNCYIIKSGSLRISPFAEDYTDTAHWGQTAMLQIGNMIGDCIKTNILGL